ncbi:hypothetical protein [Desulfobacula sp.]|uniref:hypothetical protein n=1 Tax=Desulfobacula sp. TaxID=2593537 RepID=UPI0019C997C2|nr:hypothetical protein [Candidatus Brocadiales bacterium]MBL6995449.1 hypothetical protein [Desulfobacula sp.]
MMNLAIFCADVGSIKKNKFGWAAVLSDDEELSGTDIREFAKEIVKQIEKNTKVAIGFECPLFVPVRSNPVFVNSVRNGEGNRSWSAGAGTGALATGLVEVLWVFNEISRILGKKPQAVFQWPKFLDSESIFLWEAFVTSTAKGAGHTHDALSAVTQFKNSLPDPMRINAIEETDVFSLVGAAALRAGWSYDTSILSEQCLVIKA